MAADGVVIRKLRGGGPWGDIDSLVAEVEEEIAAPTASVKSTIKGTGSADELIVIYAGDTNIRIATGLNPVATTTSGPRVHANTSRAFRALPEGHVIAVIEEAS